MLFHWSVSNTQTGTKLRTVGVDCLRIQEVTYDVVEDERWLNILVGDEKLKANRRVHEPLGRTPFVETTRVRKEFVWESVQSASRHCKLFFEPWGTAVSQ